MNYLFIVSGPSGCGKTSFVRLLYRRELDKDISELLPECATTALSIDAKYPDRALKGSMRGRNGCPIVPVDVIDADPATYECIMFHNALNRLAKNGIMRLSQDATLLRFLARNPRKIVLINIKTSREQLVKFYTHRSFGREGIGLFSVLLAVVSMRLGKVRTAIKYGYSGFAEQLASRWIQIQKDVFFHVWKRSPETQFVLLDISPVTDKNGVGGFSLDSVKTFDGFNPCVFDD
ncbi:MAG: hypothetical protein ACSHYC_02310 [Alphaproteobacteria bacterium]